MYKLIRGKPLNEINFEFVKAKSGKYKNKLVCQDIFVFDTETTSDFVDKDGVFLFDYENPERAQNALKHSVCYLWQFGINEDTRYIGRELTDFVDLLHDLSFYIPDVAKIFCWIHNLSFDFCFLQNVLKFDNVFARKPRHPMSATCNKFKIEFRCSYVLSGLKLSTWAKSLNMPVQKLTMDYKQLRTPKTELSDEVIKYSIADLDVMYYGLKSYKTRYGGTHLIPLTHTGEMRKACEEIMSTEYNYCEKITRLMPQNLTDYVEQAHAFVGGTVLCNWLYKDRIIEDLTCYDIASSYPYVLCACKYPMSIFFKCPRGKESNYMYNDDYVYIVRFKATYIESNYNCHFLSRSKALKIKNVVADNGRVVSADEVEYILIGSDYEIFLKAYTAKTIEIISFKFARAGYLNNKFRKFIISLYKDKTTLKGVTGREEEYQNKKALINAGYGDFVTKIFSDTIIYNYENKNKIWEVQPLDEDSFAKSLKTLNKKKFKNYKAFCQGIFVTGWARKRIWDAVIGENWHEPLDEKIVYTDTDSLKLVDCDERYFESQNKIVLTRLHEIADELKIPFEDLSPKDIKGVAHPLGVWEKEHDVKRFKSLGCKQYICEYEDGTKQLTCAGISKNAVSIFKDIDDFEIDRQLTEKELFDAGAEKLTPYYDIEYPVVTYPDGYRCTYKSGVCLMPTTFNLSITPSDLLLLFNEVKSRLNKIYYTKGI